MQEGSSLRKAEKAVELKTLFCNLMVSKDTTILFCIIKFNTKKAILKLSKKLFGPTMVGMLYVFVCFQVQMQFNGFDRYRNVCMK